VDCTTNGPGEREAFPMGDEIAVVIPGYMGKEFLFELCERLKKSLEPITDRFSIILVDDGSPDNPWPQIVALGSADRRIRGLQLSRNFGQAQAITAGVDHARACWYVVMDCDLQDAPEDIPLLYEKALAGFDIVVATRRRKRHRLIKRTTARLFYAIFDRLSGVSLDWSIGNFRIFSENVASGFRQMREQLRWVPASFSFMGFRVGQVDVPHYPRPSGGSSYTTRKLVALAVRIIIAHSYVPLTWTAIGGLIITCLAMAAALAIVVRTLAWGSPVPGWASLIVAVFLMGGFQMFAAGVIGIYVGKARRSAKQKSGRFISFATSQTSPGLKRLPAHILLSLPVSRGQTLLFRPIKLRVEF
jgi:polyisoprenyl-phosphate glycosyltransferase